MNVKSHYHDPPALPDVKVCFNLISNDQTRSHGPTYPIHINPMMNEPVMCFISHYRGIVFWTGNTHRLRWTKSAR